MTFTPARCILAVAAAFPSLAAAQDLTFSGGITATSNYLSDGASDSGGKPALQTFFEVSKNGIYGGAWASNIKDADGNTAALDLSAGYRGDLASGLAYDLGYTQHLFNKTHGRSAELTGALDYALSDKLSLSGELSYDLTEKGLGATLGATYELAQGWSVYGDVGRPDPASSVFWDGGARYAVNDRVSLDLQYQDTTASKGLVALSVTYAIGDGAK